MDQPSATTDWLRTRATLLHRLGEPDQEKSWVEFDRLYRGFVRGIARRAGLSEADADDVVQEVFISVAQKIGKFESDPARGTFRGWLSKLTRWRITDRHRKNGREFARRAPVSGLSPDGATAADEIDKLPDPAADEHRAEETEWQRLLLESALRKMAAQVPAKHFQAFDLYNRQGWSVFRVAAELGISPATVYVVSHRLTKRLRTEIEQLRTQLD